MSGMYALNEEFLLQEAHDRAARLRSERGKRFWRPRVAREDR
jgi:hypothetical protein